MNVVTLSNSDRLGIYTHLVGLSEESKRTRFFGPITEEGIRRYVGKLDFADSDVGFGVYDDDLNLIAFTHAHVTEVKDHSMTAEVGFSVSDDHRGRGYGSMMFARLRSWCKANSIDTIYVECLSTNTAMKELAKKNGASIIMDGDLIGKIDMRADWLDRFIAIRDTFKHDQLSLVDLSVKRQVKAMKDLLFKPFDVMETTVSFYNKELNDGL